LSAATVGDIVGLPTSVAGDGGGVKAMELIVPLAFGEMRRRQAPLNRPSGPQMPSCSAFSTSLGEGLRVGCSAKQLLYWMESGKTLIYL